MNEGGRAPATVSVDVDPVDLHLAGYGVDAARPDPLVYQIAIPRLLERLAEAGLRATWFFVARDAGTQRRAIAAVAAAGHEVASHSLSHPSALTRLPPERLRVELRESRRRLEQAGGAPVVGFRSPSWDLDGRSAEGLLDAGYRYDASSYPTPLLVAAKLLLALKAGRRRPAPAPRLWPFSLARLPHRWRLGERELHEFPLSVTPGLRLPIYHTACFLAGGARTLRMIAATAGRAEALSYPVHAVDVLGLAEDGVDPRLARHPGMGLPLAEKLALLDASLRAIAARFDARPFRSRLEQPAA